MTVHARSMVYARYGVYLSARSIQNAKAQRTHEETANVCTDYAIKVFIIHCVIEYGLSGIYFTNQKDFLSEYLM